MCLESIGSRVAQKSVVEEFEKGCRVGRYLAQMICWFAVGCSRV